MAEPINDPEYWSRRLRQAMERGLLHEAVFRCPLERWLRIEAKHKEILARLVKPDDAILDVGCGWGRLLGLLPPEWRGAYLGVDLSSAFITEASDLVESGGRIQFRCGKAEDLEPQPITYSWAVLISFRPMVKRNRGGDAWCEIEANVRRLASRLLYLEYDENDEGSVE